MTDRDAAIERALAIADRALERVEALIPRMEKDVNTLLMALRLGVAMREAQRRYRGSDAPDVVEVARKAEAAFDAVAKAALDEIVP